MEDPGRLGDEHLCPLGQTLVADVQDGPVPVVVVEEAKVVAALVQLLPKLPREGHAHVVLRTHPVGYLNLEKKPNFFCGPKRFFSYLGE